MTPPNSGKFTEQESIEVTKVHGDLSQEVVKITVDRLSLILHKHSASIEQKRGWIAPLGIFLTILIVLLTSTFNKVIWSGDTWTAIFIIGAGLTFVWLIKALWRSYKSESIENLIEKIKRQENEK